MNSRGMFEKAKKCLPGGVTYGFRYIEPYPFYVAKGKGSRLWDVDGNEYTEFRSLFLGIQYLSWCSQI
jgi:glutamate-1-semialdehyde 2,1-aminomutase